MGRNGRAAFGAVAGLLGLDLMMRATLATARIGMPTLWNGHGSKSPTKILLLSKTTHLQVLRRLWPQANSVNPRLPLTSSLVKHESGGSGTRVEFRLVMLRPKVYATSATGTRAYPFDKALGKSLMVVRVVRAIGDCDRPK